MVENVWFGQGDSAAAHDMENTEEMAKNACRQYKRMEKERSVLRGDDGSINVQTPEEQAKVAARIARFGAVADPYTDGGGPGGGMGMAGGMGGGGGGGGGGEAELTPEELARRAARAARFGTSLPPPEQRAAPVVDEKELERRQARLSRFGMDMPLMPLEMAEAGEDGQGGQGGGDGMDEAASQELPEIDADIEVSRGEGVGGGLR